jgi:hypothetical protein
MRDIKVKFKFKSLPKISESHKPAVPNIKMGAILKKPSVEKRKNISKNKIILVITLFIILIGVSIGLTSGKEVKKAYKKATVAQASIEKVNKAIKDTNSELNLKQINEEIITSKENLQLASTDMSKVNYLKPIPGVGLVIDTIDRLINGGYYTVSAFARLFQEGQQSSTILTKGFTNIESMDITDVKTLVASFMKIKPTIDQSSDDLIKAEREINGIPFFMKISRVKKITDNFYANVPPVRAALSDSSMMMERLPKILGFDREKTYIIFFLNNNEMTAIGGIPGSLGIMKIDHGQLSDFKIENVYNVVSEGRIEFKGLSHYSSDIPTFAKELSNNYQELNENNKIDGILLVDTEILKEILKSTGPINVENQEYDYNYVLTESNVIDIIERHTKKTWWAIGEPSTDRKEVLNILLEEILNKIPSLKQENLVKFVGGLDRLIKEKHLMFYFKDNELESLVEKYNADGRIKDSKGDYCLVIDDNFAWSKSHQVLEKGVHYKLNLDNRNAELSLDYFLNHPGNWKIWSIASYTRVYLPAGTKIYRNENFNDDSFITDNPAAEEYQKSAEVSRVNKEIFAGWMNIEPLENKNYKLFYQLPSDIFSKKEYTLLFQKQQGILNTSLDIEINIGDRKIRKIEPNNCKINGNIVSWKTDLLQDREFKIYFW